MDDLIFLQVYGTSHPEPYNMSNVVAPTALIGGDRDGFVVKRDIDILASQLPNVVMNYQVSSLIKVFTSKIGIK